MNELKRYSLYGRNANGDFDPHMEPKTDGGWVLASEVNAVISSLRREVDAKQATIDALMLEYCPDEMSQEQRDEWARHQVVLIDEASLRARYSDFRFDTDKSKP